MAKQPGSAEEVDSFIAQTDTSETRMVRAASSWDCLVWALFSSVSPTLPFTLQQTTGLPLSSTMLMLDSSISRSHCSWRQLLFHCLGVVRGTPYLLRWILGIVGIGCCLYLVVKTILQFAQDYPPRVIWSLRRWANGPRYRCLSFTRITSCNRGNLFLA